MPTHNCRWRARLLVHGSGQCHGQFGDLGVTSAGSLARAGADLRAAPTGYAIGYVSTGVLRVGALSLTLSVAGFRMVNRFLIVRSRGSEPIIAPKFA